MTTESNTFGEQYLPEHYRNAFDRAPYGNFNLVNTIYTLRQRSEPSSLTVYRFYFIGGLPNIQLFVVVNDYFLG